MPNDNQVGIINNPRGELTATIDLIPNEKTGNATVEVKGVSGRRLAWQTVEGDTTADQAADLGFALYNGYVFGYFDCAAETRSAVDALANKACFTH